MKLNRTILLKMFKYLTNSNINKDKYHFIGGIEYINNYASFFDHIEISEINNKYYFDTYYVESTILRLAVIDKDIFDFLYRKYTRKNKLQKIVE